MDGKEAKYYTTTINESYNAKGKLVQVTTSTVYEKSKEAGFYANGITDWGYTREGSKGSGELFTIIKVKKYESDNNGVGRQEITKVGDVYHSSPEDNKKHGGYGGFAFYSENGQGEETRVGSFDDLTMVEMSGLLTKAKFASEVGVWENTTEGIDIIEEKIKEMQEERKKAEETKPTSPSSSSVNTKQGTTTTTAQQAQKTKQPLRLQTPPGTPKDKNGNDSAVGSYKQAIDMWNNYYKKNNPNSESKYRIDKKGDTLIYTYDHN